ncbi:MAG: DHA2 family efflux MFS transporter permease subunit [Gemmatimonadota bacterium]
MTASALAVPRPAYNPHAGKWLVAIGVTLGSVIELIDTSIVNVALTHISANLGVSVEEVTWVSVGYILAAVIILPMTGWLAAYFGRKRYFTISIIIFTIASVFCGAAGSLTSLVFWRIIQGLGGGALISTAQAILFDAFPIEERTLASAIFGIGMMVGPAIGPTLGGLIVDRFQWPWIFYINVPVGIIATVVVAAYVKDPPDHGRPGKVDYFGLILLAMGIGSLQFVLERGQHYDWFDSPMIFGLLVLAVVAIGTMIWWELRVKDPILDLRVLKDRSLLTGSMFGAVLGMGLYGSTFALPLLAQGLMRFDAETTGIIMFPGAVGSALSMMMIAKIGNRVDGRWLIALGAMILSYSMFGHSHFTLETSRAQMLWPVALRGVGIGLMFVPLTASALARLSGRKLGQGAAIFNLSRQLGGSIGIAALATLLVRFTATYRAVLSEHITLYDPAVQARIAAGTKAFMATSPDSVTATHRAIEAVSRTLDAQASLLAYEQIFRIVGVIFLLSMPLILFLERPRGKGPVDVH